MAKLPDLHRDPTLEAVDRAIEDSQDRVQRQYLGMSALGRECERELWYSFRWASEIAFNAATLKRFADGHHGEDLQAARLRMVDGIELHTHDEHGRQFGFYDLGGHLRGHMDGAIRGLVQAPKTFHVWEHKQVDEKKQRALLKAVEKHGQKAALEAWDPVYYAQGILYMHFSGMTRHYLTCSTPGGRHTVSVRTDAHPPTAWRLLKRARAIIASPTPPPGISDNPDHFVCQWCDHKDVCWGNQVPEVSCRTCVHATPELDGDRRWNCAYHQRDITVEEQRRGCGGHLFIPDLVPLRVVDASPEDNSVTYEGGVKNGGDDGVDSKTLREDLNAGL